MAKDKVSFLSVNCRLRGVPSCANKELLTDITRHEWGFKGYIVSDADAVVNIITKHKYLNNSADTVAATISAGCNLELASTIYNATLDALKAGKLTEHQIRYLNTFSKTVKGR